MISRLTLMTFCCFRTFRHPSNLKINKYLTLGFYWREVQMSGVEEQAWGYFQVGLEILSGRQTWRYFHVGLGILSGRHGDTFM